MSKSKAALVIQRPAFLLLSSFSRFFEAFSDASEFDNGLGQFFRVLASDFGVPLRRGEGIGGERGSTFLLANQVDCVVNPHYAVGNKVGLFRLTAAYPCNGK